MDLHTLTFHFGMPGRGGLRDLPVANEICGRLPTHDVGESKDYCRLGLRL